jgi:hypothetical protein
MTFCRYLVIYRFCRNICQGADLVDPYLKSICKFIAKKNFSDSCFIVNEIQISFFDRIAFAIRFFNTKTLKYIFNKNI